MKDATSSAYQRCWRWVIQRIRVAGWSLLSAAMFLALAFIAHPENRLVLWVYRVTMVLSAGLALLHAAYAIRFGKKLD